MPGQGMLIKFDLTHIARLSIFMFIFFAFYFWDYSVISTLLIMFYIPSQGSHFKSNGNFWFPASILFMYPKYESRFSILQRENTLVFLFSCFVVKRKRLQCFCRTYEFIKIVRPQKNVGSKGSPVATWPCLCYSLNIFKHRDSTVPPDNWNLTTHMMKFSPYKFPIFQLVSTASFSVVLHL